MRKILLSILVIILIEIASFIIVGNLIGVFYTLFTILLTGIIGILIAKKLGVQSVQNMRNSLSEGAPPGPAMIDTFLIFIGGALLVIPGFLTDVLGLTLVLPFTRKLYKPAIYMWLRKKMNNGQIFMIHR